MSERSVSEQPAEEQPAEEGRPRESRRDETGAPPRPPRPPLSDRTPAPIAASKTTSPLVVAARFAWFAGYLVGALVLLSLFLRRETQFDRLRDLIDELQPGRDASTVDTAAGVVYWSTFGVLAAFLVLEVLLRPASERRAGGRWTLLVVLLAHAAVALAAEAFVAIGAEAPAFRALLLTQLGLAALALLLTAIGARSARR